MSSRWGSRKSLAVRATRPALLAMTVASLLAVACTSSSVDTTATGTAIPGSPATAAPGDAPEPIGPYALLTDPEWTFRDATALTPQETLESGERPPLDWYANYAQSFYFDSGPPGAPPGTMREDHNIRISGHPATLADSRAAIGLAFDFHDITVHGWEAAAGAEQDGEALLLLAHGDASILVLSYQVDLATLTELAAAIESVDAPAWLAAGGTIR